MERKNVHRYINTGQNMCCVLFLSTCSSCAVFTHFVCWKADSDSWIRDLVRWREKEVWKRIWDRHHHLVFGFRPGICRWDVSTLIKNVMMTYLTHAHAHTQWSTQTTAGRAFGDKGFCKHGLSMSLSHRGHTCVLWSRGGGFLNGGCQVE